MNNTTNKPDTAAKKEYYGMTEFMEVIYNLSFSQGFYGRLYCDLLNWKENDPDYFLELTYQVEAARLTSDLDVIFWLET